MISEHDLARVQENMDELEEEANKINAMLTEMKIHVKQVLWDLREVISEAGAK